MGDSNDFEGLSEEEIAAIEDDDDNKEELDDQNSDEDDALDQKDDENATDEDEDESDSKGADEDLDEDESGGSDDESDESDSGDSKDDEKPDDEKEGQEDKKDDSDAEDDSSDADDSDDSKSSVDAEFQGKIAALDSKIVALDEKLDEGDLPFDEYKKQLLGIGAEKEGLKTEQNEIRTRALVREETARMQAETSWKAEQADFFETNDYMKENQIVYDSFAREVNRLLADKTWASKPGTDVLAEAKSTVDKAFGIKPGEKEDTSKEKKEASAGEKAVKDAKKASGKKAAPQTLKDVPASDTNMDGGAFDHLDKLDGVELEKALAKLTEEEMDAYAKA